MGMLWLLGGVLAGCAHHSGPEDLKGRPLLVCHSQQTAGLPLCKRVGAPYREALAAARADFEQALKTFAEGDSEDQRAFMRCMRQLSSYEEAVGILDEDIQVFFIPTTRCLEPGDLMAGAGATYTFRRDGLVIRERVFHE